MYREEILEHYKNPQNYRKLGKYNRHGRQLNPFCGDDIEIFVDIESNVIKDIGFVGSGCAISMASASLLTEFVKEKNTKELTKFGQEDMLNMLGVDVSATRKKCALLAHFVFRECLYGKTKGKS